MVGNCDRRLIAMLTVTVPVGPTFSDSHVAMDPPPPPISKQLTLAPIPKVLKALLGQRIETVLEQ
jgi:hypothetical protein